ncbi:hypothetical protein LPTSP2_04680 [Leptospira ellinghausenii]|uniref:Uncharacterized protein n=1 Tax=Leptospira ellinghausenii TaxID=1917822 RepID=A0A2P2D990_9LEPT|nr:hypothetical protein [Leptospira ellinghausenii]GBF41196.1 hypothetical protein LPTSP2_04680 [Leptospira ellinghausenii]
MENLKIEYILYTLTFTTLIYIVFKLSKQSTKQNETKIPIPNPFRIRGKIELSELQKLLTEINDIIFKIEKNTDEDPKKFWLRINELITTIPILSPYDKPPLINFDEEVKSEDLKLFKIYLNSKKELISDRIRLIEKKGENKTVDINGEGSLYSLELILKYFNNHISRLEDEINNLKFYSYISVLFGNILFIFGIIVIFTNSSNLINYMENGKIFEYQYFDNSLYVFTRYFLPFISKGILVLILEYLSYFFLKSFFESRKQEKYYYDKITEANFKMYALLATYYTENESIFQEVLKELITSENTMKNKEIA